MKEQILHRVLTIDTGDNIGFAYWLRDSKRNGLPFPAEYGRVSLKQKERGTLADELKYSSHNFNSILEQMNAAYKSPQLCIIEGVEAWTGSLRSMTSLTRGNLFKLAYNVGIFSQCCIDWGIEFRIILAREWKGQISDKLVMERVEKICGLTFKKADIHCVDAIGMGYALMGYFHHTSNRKQATRRYKLKK